MNSRSGPVVVLFAIAAFFVAFLPKTYFSDSKKDVTKSEKAEQAMARPPAFPLPEGPLKPIQEFLAIGEEQPGGKPGCSPTRFQSPVEVLKTFLVKTASPG